MFLATPPRRMPRLFLSLLLCFTLLLSSCSQSTPTPDSKNSTIKDNTTSQEFDNFTNALFKETVASDALSLNYTLAHPETYGVTKQAGGFQPISYEDLQQSAPESENLLYKLHQFDKDKLSLPQKILYDSLSYTLEMNQKGSDFLLFSRPLSPVTGLQAQLPVLLAEYTFDSVEDIEDYFALLQSIPSYFTSILAFMELQANQSLLPSRDTLNQIVNQCTTFTQNGGSKILTSSFSSRLKKCTFLDKSTKRTYRQTNKDLVDTCVLPAYDELVNGLNVLLTRAGTNGSLCSYENGKSYYEYLFASETGSTQSPDKYFEELTLRLDKAKQTLLSYAKKDPSLFSKLSTHAASKVPPAEQLTSLSQAICADFPETSDVNFCVSYVDPSLEDYLSPAFYLTPPLDAYTENAIYINNSSRFAGSDLSSTLAHEGYPGHLYQNVYYRQQNRPLLCYALNFNGYTEGWATYAENYSYKYLGYTKDEVGILRNNAVVSLCIYGLCDIGIHYYGWGEKELLEFLLKHGSYTADTAHSLYTNIIHEPGSYLKYTIGYVEFMKLKTAAKTKMGDRYSEKAFHTFVLSAGPAPFSVLLQYMPQLWPPLEQGPVQ